MKLRRPHGSLVRPVWAGVIVGYLTLAHPTIGESLTAVKLLVDSGVDMLEIGWPSLRPYLDGPTIRQSHFRARATLLDNLKSPHHARYFAEKGWAILAKIRSQIDHPVIFMGYRADIWPDHVDMLQRSREIGIDTLLIPDAKKNELSSLGNHTIIRIFDPSMGNEQVKDQALTVQGFGYVKTSSGLTGEQGLIDWDRLTTIVARIRRVRPGVPLMAGFGLKKVEDVIKLRQIGFSGVIVGTAIVEYLMKRDWKGLARYIRQLRYALE